MEERSNSLSKCISAPSLLIIGNGRVAVHFAHYFTLEKISHCTWSRQQPVALLRSLLDRCSHVLLLISDRAIEDFYLAHPELKTKTVIHFSGALVSNQIPGAHPLMTFASELYDLETYRRIPFVVDEGETLAALLPGLRNPSAALAKNQKVLYHALCVLSGNYTTMLWEKVFAEFRERFHLPKSILVPYLEQIMRNLIAAPGGQSVLTGPLVRGDLAVIDRHLEALNGDPFREVYEAFVTAHAATASNPLGHAQPEGHHP